MDRKTCLICDDLAVIEVMSVGGQFAPLCGLHWADYCFGSESSTAQELEKFFDDGRTGDRAETVNLTVERYGVTYRTDEKRAPYDAKGKRTD